LANKAGSRTRKQGQRSSFMQRNRGFLAVLTIIIVIGITSVLYIKSATNHQVGAIGQNSTSSSPSPGATAIIPTATNTTSRPISSPTPPSPTPPAQTSLKPPSPIPSDSKAILPSQILDLTDWKITLPIAPPGSSDAEEITQPQLTRFSLAPYFAVDGAHNGVVFQADAGGATTSGSSYPRSELREMTDDGTQEASWSIAAAGTNMMSVTEASTALPKAKPQVVTAQIHDASSDIIEILADGERSNSPGTYSICLRYNGSEQKTCLDDNYVPGTPYTIQMSASDGHIVIYYNGVQKFDFANTTTGCYFKVGAYTQSNVSKGDASSAYGQVVIYNLHVTHSSP
jgi:hypothetical protein